VPLYRDPKSDMPVTQFNMKYVEQAGLVKFDFLGLKTLTVIQKAVELIKQEHGKNIDPLLLPLDDKKTFDMMSEGKTVGVFQLESTGMRSTLSGMKPDRFEDIIALVSLYRPGPMENIPRYIKIKDGDEEADYMHPKLESILKETFGIMIYQEQVMQAAQILSGYSLGGADLLRRAMGKKIKEEMDKQRAMFVNGATAHNQIPENQSNEIFDQIAKFAGYGFNKSHAAAYALIAYQTGWLKANYPVEFMAASMTLDKGNTDKLAIFKQDCVTLDIPILTPDINMSEVDFKVEGTAIRYAMAALKGVGENAMHMVVHERNTNGKFKDIYNFSERVDPKALNKRQIQGLASSGGFESIGLNRSTVHSQAETILRYSQNIHADKDTGQEGLFGGSDLETQNRPVIDNINEWQQLEKLANEFKAIGFYLSAHPLDPRMAMLERLGVKSISKIETLMQDTTYLKLKVAGVLIGKQERISKSGNKFAFLQISDPTAVIEVMIFSELLASKRDLLVTGTNLLIELEVQQKDDQIRILGQNISLLDNVLSDKSRRTHITLNDTDAINDIQSILKNDTGGLAQIIFSVPIDNDRYVDIKINGMYKLSPDTVYTLQNMNGVTSIVDL
jgi:DNA polymerase-3 subunit alpha